MLEVGTTNYADDRLSIKKALSHMESLTGGYNGYSLGEPSARFGWTFFRLSFRDGLQAGIESEFSEMIARYRSGGANEKFAEFMADYFASKGCKVRISVVPD